MFSPAISQLFILLTYNKRRFSFPFQSSQLFLSFSEWKNFLSIWEPFFFERRGWKRWDGSLYVSSWCYFCSLLYPVLLYPVLLYCVLLYPVLLYPVLLYSVIRKICSVCLLELFFGGNGGNWWHKLVSIVSIEFLQDEHQYKLEMKRFFLLTKVQLIYPLIFSLSLSLSYLLFAIIPSFLPLSFLSLSSLVPLLLAFEICKSGRMGFQGTISFQMYQLQGTISFQMYQLQGTISFQMYQLTWWFFKLWIRHVNVASLPTGTVKFCILSTK